ncbi:MAG TPA: biopolymer transporter ExbD [Phycisphaerales bacterium]|nr:biopolymer transporter ExbD [Phycisphaerales bacterium]HIB49931.1 biopolymer transporter ExbD [Phycisphaerales bacterium]HIN83978.1 biopolymer transporter ExbD [Phycisphaerales bacterium]HIO20570.1 biopolymer transporter ExbD [Phycisphaerales bacterium]
MRPIRRTDYDTRIEMMPLIDVIFLLLTFFIYAMVLMVRAEILPVPLESYISGTTAEPRQTISVTIAVDGNIYVGQTIVQLSNVAKVVAQQRETSPESAVYLVVEDGEAIVDRGPLLTGTWDQLRNAGLEIFLVGAPKPQGETNEK